MPTQEELDSWSGAENFKPRVDAKKVDIDKMKLQFVIKKRQAEDIELGEELKGTVIRVRVEYLHWPQEYAGEHWSTSEENGQGSDFTLYHCVKGQPRTQISRGGLAYLQGRGPRGKLSMGQVLYVLDGDCVLYRVCVRGSSFGELLDYYKEVGKSGDHIYNYITTLGIVEKTNEKSDKKYPVITFKKGKKLDDEQQEIVYDHMKELDRNFLAMQIAQKKEPVPEVKPEDIPVINEEGQSTTGNPPPEKPRSVVKDGIDVRDIPFG